MAEHLIKMSVMILDLNAVSNVLTKGQQRQVILRVLLKSWAKLKFIMTHSSSISTLSQFSHHFLA